MSEPRRFGDYLLAAGIALAALAVSPAGIQFISGRPDLSLRVNAISLALVVFLLTVLGAVLSRGRLRTVFFHLVIWTALLPLLVAAEAAAIAFHLADRIAPIEHPEMLKGGGRWPPQLLSEARWSRQRDGVRTYRPWSGNGVVINSTGLRTAEPQPKQPGEWRIAITGGSTVYGWRLLDVDTLPVLVQQALRRKHPNVSVYNFGIEGATIARELDLLKRFHKQYEIDEVVFYTGGNDVINSYLGALSSGDIARRVGVNLNAFELVRSVSRLTAVTIGPSPQTLARLDETVLPEIMKHNSLRLGIEAADAYCRTETLRCQVMLQPSLYTRRPPRGPEVAMLQNADRIYPRMGALGVKMYRDVLDKPPQMPVADLSDVFDSSEQPFFVDTLHINEAGNAYLAEKVAVRLSPRLP